MYRISDTEPTRLVEDKWCKEPTAMPGTEDFMHVTSLDAGGYEWAEFHAWYSPRQRRYFWSGQTGCSCYSYVVDSLGDLQVGSRDDLLRSIHEWVQEDAQYYNVDGIALQQQVRDFREPQQ